MRTAHSTCSTLTAVVSHRPQALPGISTACVGFRSRNRARELADNRKAVVVDVSQLGLEEVQMFAASFILRKVYREMFKWPQDHTMKLAVVLDEAHRMAKDELGELVAPPRCQ
jgi:hypothetical protein